MKIRKNDKVKIITGKDKGKEGTVLKVLIQEGRVVVEGVNIVKKHVKPGAVSKEGGIIEVEKPINMSNVMVMCGKCKRPVRVCFLIKEGKKTRVCNKCKGKLN